MFKMIGLRLPEELIKRIKEYVKKKKNIRSYSMGEMIRIAVEEYLDKHK